MSGVGLGSIGVPSALPGFTTYVGGNPIGSPGTALNFNLDDFNVALLNEKLDVALTHILNNDVKLKGKNVAGNQVELIQLSATNELFIGNNNSTNYDNIKLSCGLGSSVLELSRTGGGKLLCGGVNKRIEFDETGLTARRNITFNDAAGKLYPATNIKPVETGLTAVREQYYPDKSTKLLGFYDAIPMGFTDYQSGSCVGGNMSGIWGEGILESMTTYGTSQGAGTSSSAPAYRYAGTGTVVDTRAGERSNDYITRRICSPVLWARVHIAPDVNVDTRWFCGFSNSVDYPLTLILHWIIKVDLDLL